MAKRYTDGQKEKILAYAAQHGPEAAAAHFEMAKSAVYSWRHAAKKANGATNGLGALSRADAIMHAERWRKAYLALVQAETPTAAAVVDAVRGGDK